jgi:hypothetical protein
LAKHGRVEIVDRELAKHVVVAGFRSMSDITGLLPLLQKHCTADEYLAYRSAITELAGAIVAQIINPAFAGQPGLEQEVEASVNKYQKVL